MSVHERSESRFYAVASLRSGEIEREFITDESRSGYSYRTDAEREGVPKVRAEVEGWMRQVERLTGFVPEPPTVKISIEQRTTTTLTVESKMRHFIAEWSPNTEEK